jgi:ribosomal protein S18 acetylase RimI-like enzyme
MARTYDLAAVREILETDRPWAAYALGDLTPGFVEHSEWYWTGPHTPAVVLLYRREATPVLFSLGPAAEVQAILHGLPRVPSAYLSISVPHIDLVAQHAPIVERMAMYRMQLDPAAFAHEEVPSALRLGAEDVPALQALFADGEANHEAPDFFAPWMVKQGVYYGVYEQGELIAAAGTHLVAEQTGVAAVGNVYTRRDRRGRRLARHTTGAVAAALLARGIPTIVLNVNQKNAAALRVYEALGFRRYCPFWEGRTGGWSDAPAPMQSGR